MRFLVDTHTHTIASGHAYSTLKENAEEAYKKGLEGFVCTDHAPAVEFCAPDYILSSVLRFVPDEIEGVRLIRGIELNIMDEDGTVDLPAERLQYTEFAIASMHDITYDDRGLQGNTSAVIGALQNPYVDVVGHPGNAMYPIDREAFVKEVARQNKLVEVNNHSFEFREGSKENCIKIINLCKKHNVRITVGSDAHTCYSVGRIDLAISALEECGFPEELVVCANLERFLAYLEERKKRVG